MITQTGKIKCDSCGRWIGFADLESGQAKHVLIEPDNAFGPERYESLCPNCFLPTITIAGLNYQEIRERLSKGNYAQYANFPIEISLEIDLSNSS